MNDWKGRLNPYGYWNATDVPHCEAPPLVEMFTFCCTQMDGVADTPAGSQATLLPQATVPQAQAAGVKAISSSSTVTIARRVAAFADKYKIEWAGHGHDNVADPEEFAKPETFELIMSLSKHIGVNLDIGHFTAANYDPIPFIQKHHDRITNLHIKDRKKDHGPNVAVWGTGDTPIKDVMQLLKKEKYPIPANMELEYGIPEGSDIVTEAKKCFAYVKSCLA